MSPDQDMSLGLNVAFGLISDECAVICNACTSRLVSARKANKPPARGRR
jgi:Cu/Ag efflux pump CusA